MTANNVSCAHPLIRPYAGQAPQHARFISGMDLAASVASASPTPTPLLCHQKTHSADVLSPIIGWQNPKHVNPAQMWPHKVYAIAAAMSSTPMS